MRNKGSQLLFIYLPRMEISSSRTGEVEDKKEVRKMTQAIRDFFLQVEKMSVAADQGVPGAVGRDCLRSYLSSELVDSDDTFIDYMNSLKNKIDVEEAQMMVAFCDRGVPK